MVLRFRVLAIVLLVFVIAAQAQGGLVQPPSLPMRVVTETLYGRRIIDPYRYFEAQDAQVTNWIKAQGVYTRQVFDSIPGRASVVAKLSSIDDSSSSVSGYQRFGGREFFLRPGRTDNNLMVRDKHGERRLIDTAAFIANHGASIAIDYFLPSPDGTKVAAGVSRSGSEDDSVYVVDAANGHIIAGPLDRARAGLLSWNDAGNVLYVNRLRNLATNAPATDKYKFSSVDAWNLKSPPVKIIGGTSGPRMQATEFPQVVVSQSAPMAALVGINGAQSELAIWVAPKNEIGSRTMAWKQIVARSDGVTAFAMQGDTLFLLSNHNAPTFKVLALKVGEPLSGASTLLPARSDHIIASIHAAADGLYIVERVGLYSHLLRVARGTTSPTEIPLPGRGDVSDAFTDPASDGIAFLLQSWTFPRREYFFDPTVGSVRDLGLATQPVPKSVAARDLQVKAKDGALVPLTVISPKHQHRPLVTIVQVYGSYGISLLPYYSAFMTSFVDDGNVYAVCHARGGGELGEAWRLGGKDASKPNTWRDLIACGEDLIARGIARRDGLFIYGGSAGGIAVGLAMAERPELFAGVIDAVPPANIIRMEFTPDGPLETQEFGSVKTERGFRNLLAMDTYQNIQKDVGYPPVLITMGMNDPRIAPWQPAKLAAKLIAYGDHALLRVDVDGGHGIGATKHQYDQMFADIFTFVYWHSGRPGWVPALPRENTLHTR